MQVGEKKAIKTNKFKSYRFDLRGSLKLLVIIYYYYTSKADTKLEGGLNSL